MPQTRQTTLRKYFNKHLEPTPLMKSGGGKTFEDITHINGMGWVGRENPTKKQPFRTFNLEFEDPRARDAAFDKTLGDIEYEESFSCADNAKMISQIEYNNEKQAMRVSFISDGSIVVYPNVPPSIYAQLKHANYNGDGRAPPGHVGATFWDLIRIHYRNYFVRYGSKYNYIYVKKGPSQGQRSSEYTKEYFDPFEGKDVKGKPSSLMKKTKRVQDEAFQSGLLRMTGKNDKQHEGRAPKLDLMEAAKNFGIDTSELPSTPAPSNKPEEHVKMTVAQYKNLIKGLGGQ